MGQCVGTVILSGDGSALTAVIDDRLFLYFSTAPDQGAPTAGSRSVYDENLAAGITGAGTDQAGNQLASTSPGGALTTTITPGSKPVDADVVVTGTGIPRDTVQNQEDAAIVTTSVSGDGPVDAFFRFITSPVRMLTGE